MNIELSELEVKILDQALDCFIRTHLGQWDAAVELAVYHLACTKGSFRQSVFPEETDEESRARLEDARHLVSAASELVTGIRHGSPGLFNPKVSDWARLAWRIRNRLKGDELRISMVDETGKATS